MREKGFCSICWKVDNVTSCALCGRSVCMNCIDKATGICKRCKGGRVIEGATATPHHKPDRSVEEFNSML